MYMQEDLNDDMSDDEIVMWLLLQYGSMDKAWNALDEGTIGIPPGPLKEEFASQRVQEVLHLHRVKALLGKI